MELNSYRWEFYQALCSYIAGQQDRSVGISGSLGAALPNRVLVVTIENVSPVPARVLKNTPRYLIVGRIFKAR